MGKRSGEAERISTLVLGALAVQPGMTAIELTEALGRAGLRASKTAINAVLYAAKDQFWRDDGSPPRWFLHGQASESRARHEKRADEAVSSGLYAWQEEALTAWSRAGHRGIVEAVTGTGKTRVGLEVVRQSVEIGAKAMILVPTVELLRQWLEQLGEAFPDKRLGQLGDGRRTTWGAADIVVAVVNSARSANLGSPGPRAVLVADECHRYGTEGNAAALDERFERRLGLSATYGRSDDGNAAFLDPYFGDVCFRMDYRRAIADDVTAHFKVALVGVRFTASERHAYDEANRAAYDAQRWLINGGYVRETPFGEFMKDVSLLAEGEHGRATWKARAFLRGFSERRQVLAETRAKRAYLKDLIPAFTAADRSIVFTQTVDGARTAAADIAADGVSAVSVHSQLVPDERRNALAAFSEGRVKVIAAPQVLDEGVDVPAADLAVIVAASRSQRQMIQRMGRVLRRKPDGRLARFAILYVEGTSEDPENGAHETFLNEIVDVADRVQTFSSRAKASDVCAFLSDFAPTGDRSAVAPGRRRIKQSAGAAASPQAASASPRASRAPTSAPARARPARRRPRRSMSSEEVGLLMRLLEQYRRSHGDAAYEHHSIELDQVLRNAVMTCAAGDISEAIKMSSAPSAIAAVLEGNVVPTAGSVPSESPGARAAAAGPNGAVTRSRRRPSQPSRTSATSKTPPVRPKAEPRQDRSQPPERPLYGGVPAEARFCPSCDRLEVSCVC